MFTVASRSCAGRRRAINQDACCALTARAGGREVAFFAVCDGVGGLSCGEVASSGTVRELARWFEGWVVAAGGARELDLAEAADSLSAFSASLNERILAYSRSLNVRMGTTLTALLVAEGRYALVHVGDCRAYRLRRRLAEQLSEDQARGGAILQAVGAQPGLAPQVAFGAIEAGDVVVLCTDGLYRRLGAQGLLEGLADVSGAGEARLGEAEERLIERAMALGETDNITAVCFCWEGEEPARGALSGAGGRAALEQPCAAVADEPTDVLARTGDPWCA